MKQWYVVYILLCSYQHFFTDYARIDELTSDADNKQKPSKGLTVPDLKPLSLPDLKPQVERTRLPLPKTPGEYAELAMAWRTRLIGSGLDENLNEETHHTDVGLYETLSRKSRPTDAGYYENMKRQTSHPVADYYENLYKETRGPEADHYENPDEKIPHLDDVFYKNLGHETRQPECGYYENMNQETCHPDDGHDGGLNTEVLDDYPVSGTSYYQPLNRVTTMVIEQQKICDSLDLIINRYAAEMEAATTSQDQDESDWE